MQDLLALSQTSHAAENIQLSEIAGAMQLARFPVAGWRISSFQTMKLVHLCRILRMIHSPMDVFLLFDDRNGRILLDVGSTEGLNPEPEPEPTPEELENQTIFRQLEKCSMDEYDDFQPRHPMPKDRAHRRGDSYFNSDIETVVSELGAMSGDLRNLARSALEGGPDLPTATGNTAKNRILARTRNQYPGGSPGGGVPSPKPGLPPTAPRRAPRNEPEDF